MFVSTKMMSFLSCDLQEGLLQYTNIQAMPSNIVTGKRIRLLYGNGANHWQKEKMINQLFINIGPTLQLGSLSILFLL